MNSNTHLDVTEFEWYYKYPFLSVTKVNQFMPTTLVVFIQQISVCKDKLSKTIHINAAISGKAVTPPKTACAYIAMFMMFKPSKAVV